MKRPFSSSLRFRITLGVALPLLLGFGGLSLLQYFREETLIRNEMENWAVNVGNIMISSLEHAMATHDREEVNKIIENTTSIGGILDVKLVDRNFELQANNASLQRGTVLSIQSPGCIECHRFPPANRPRALSIASDQAGVLRVANPIQNLPECTTCHGTSSKHIGVLLIDVSEEPQRRVAQATAALNLGISLVVTLLVSAWIYFNIDRLVAPRIRAFKGPLEDYATGNLATRLPISRHHDELDELAEGFNEMAGRLEFHMEASKRQRETLQRTIVEERERIARELHDSLPQMLAYLTTKIGAIRLFLEHGRKPEALENLEQLETASRNLLNDVREAIIGLRMSRNISEGLVPAVREYIDRFTKFCGVPVEFETNASETAIDPETQIHVLRIIQEALSNIRKHAQASRASVSLNLDGELLSLVIRDDGHGFDVQADRDTGSGQFGLQTMRERAESFGGEFRLHSQPGKGTTITVNLKPRAPEGT